MQQWIKCLKKENVTNWSNKLLDSSTLASAIPFNYVNKPSSIIFIIAMRLAWCAKVTLPIIVIWKILIVPNQVWRKWKKKLYLYTNGMNIPAISMNFSFQIDSENMKSHA